VAKLKQFTLTDGTVTNAVEVSERSGVSLNNARVRLASTDDPARIFKPKKIDKPVDYESYKIRSIKSRKASMYDEMFCLALKNI